MAQLFFFTLTLDNTINCEELDSCSRISNISTDRNFHQPVLDISLN